MANAPSEARTDRREGNSAEVAVRLREARERSGMSLRQLAKRLEISPSALSQIETGKSRPSVRTLYAVVSELGLSLDELFDRQAATPPADAPQAPGDDWVPRNGDGGDAVQRASDRSALVLDSGVTWERLTPQHDPHVDFLHVTYDVGGASNVGGKLVRHAGREYGVILSGRLDITVGFETNHLGPGDSISFSSEEPHILANNGTEPVQAIWFVVGRRQSDPRNPLFASPAADGP